MGGKCCYCGKPAAREAEGKGRRRTRVRAWCVKCLKVIKAFGVVDIDEYPSFEDSRECGCPGPVDVV